METGSGQTGVSLRLWVVVILLSVTPFRPYSRALRSPAGTASGGEVPASEIQWITSAMEAFPSSFSDGASCGDTGGPSCMPEREMIFQKPDFGLAIGRSPSAETREAFIRYMAPIGMWVQEVAGMPASVIIAQAMLETEDGTSRGYRRRNSFFGLSCMPEEYGKSIVYPIVINGVERRITGKCSARRPETQGAYYVVFRYPIDSVLAQMYVLLQSPRTRFYGKLRQIVSSTPTGSPNKWKKVADALDRYSVVENYPALLKQVIHNNGLYEYDQRRLCE